MPIMKGYIMTTLTNAQLAAALVSIRDDYRAQCLEQGTRFEFDFGAMVDKLRDENFAGSIYPEFDAPARAEILGNIYKLLK